MGASCSDGALALGNDVLDPPLQQQRLLQLAKNYPDIPGHGPVDGILQQWWRYCFDNIQITAVPEPDPYAMLLAGWVAVGFMTRRRHD